MGEGIKREHGEAYPSGTDAVAAPATVSGESVSNPTDLKGWEGEADDRDAASQETCLHAGAFPGVRPGKRSIL
jgi:iron complex transport system ATP-binding protein